MDIKYSCEGQPLAYTKFGGPLPVDGNGVLKWHMANWGTDMDRFHQIGILSNVFAFWNRYLPAFEFVATAKEEEAQWKIYWALNDVIHLPDGSTMTSPYSFKNNPGTLAVQYASPNLVCVINDNFDYHLDKPGPNVYELFNVLKHEIGHGLRLGHTDAPGDIMLPEYSKTNEVTQDSIDAILAFHGDHMRKFLRKPNMMMIGKLYGVPDAPEKTNGGCGIFGLLKGKK